MTCKTCPRCSTSKKLSEFSVSLRAADSAQGWCKACNSDYLREYHKFHSDLISAKKREYYIKNREVILQRQAARRAAKRQRALAP